MKQEKTCEKCARIIPVNSPGGACPHCLLGLGINDPTRDQNASSGSQAPFTVPSVDQLVGKFPNLEIEYLIGQGGMGAVYRARQTNLDRTVALKILSPQLNSNPEFAERFMREARTLAKLTHPHIVTVFDFGETDSMHYLVMEFVDGVNLRDAIETNQFSSIEAFAVISQICDALQYAHDQGIVHRDIKPENILVNKQGIIKIADFGLAKLLEPSDHDFTLTNTRQVMGTLKYMAPEQIEKPEKVDHRADLYSLGVVFYELLTGELPIGRFAVPSAKAEINKRLDEVVLKTLEKEPEQRYQQASQIKTAVAAAQIARQTPNPMPEAAPVEIVNKVPALHFKSDDVWGGMANCFGIARIREPDTLEIEYEVQDGFGVTKSAATTIEIPIADLSSVSFKTGLFRDTVAVQASSMSAVTQFPSATRGKLNLYTEKSDLETVNKFIARMNELIPGTNQSDPGFSRPTPPVKNGANDTTQAVSLHEQDAFDEGSRVPQLGLLLTGMIHLCLGMFTSYLFWIEITERSMPSYLNKIHKALGEVIWLENGSEVFWSALISWSFALVLFSTWYLLSYRKNYGLLMVFAILTCAPLHPLAILTFPLGVWVLAIIDTPLCKKIFRKAEEDRLTAYSNSWFRYAWIGILWSVFAIGGLALILFSIYFGASNRQLTSGPTDSAVVENPAAEATIYPEAISEAISGSKASTESQATSPNASRQVDNPEKATSRWEMSFLEIILVLGVLFFLTGLTLVAIVIYFISRRRNRE